jgi:hypothetical protein
VTGIPSPEGPVPVALALLDRRRPASLLSAALADAISWRMHGRRPCRRCGQSLCEPCNADWDQADRYHALARALGAVGEISAQVPNLPSAAPTT